MNWVLFFDGNCAFCSKSVQQVVRFDAQERISFAPLQGELATEKGFSGYAADTNGSMVLMRESDGRVFMHSDALIELARALGGYWNVFRIARWIPRWIRDGVYRWIARNRHRFMGKTEACMLPDAALLKRLRS
jgi:predicted DCC family thiol-disulfide oxidoreductase YuxK